MASFRSDCADFNTKGRPKQPGMGVVQFCAHEQAADVNFEVAIKPPMDASVNQSEFFRRKRKRFPSHVVERGEEGNAE